MLEAVIEQSNVLITACLSEKLRKMWTVPRGRVSLLFTGLSRLVRSTDKKALSSRIVELRSNGCC